MTHDPAWLIPRILRYLESLPSGLSISDLSRDFGINRRTAKKYLQLLEWVGTKRYCVVHRRGKRGARIFSLSVYGREEKIPRGPAHGVSVISWICYSLSLPRKTFGAALDIYSKLVENAFSDWVHWRQILIKDVAGVAVYLACQKCEIPRTLREIAKSCDIEENKLEYMRVHLEKAYQTEAQIGLKLALSIQGTQMRVGDVKKRDFGKGIVVMDRETMQKLGIYSGDTLEVVGHGITSARVLPASIRDQPNIVRIDAITRGNAGVDTNEYVIVRPAKVEEASSATFEPMNMKLTVDERFINFVKNSLMDRTFVEGDTTFVTLHGHVILLTVTKTCPGGIVRMTTNTQLEVLSKAVWENKEQSSSTHHPGEK